MKKQLKLHLIMATLVLLIVSFQNCGDNVGFSVMASKLRDMSWTGMSGSRIATTSDIQKIDWNKDGIDDLVFAYSGGSNKINEICLSVKSYKMQSHCYPLGLPNVEVEEGIVEYVHDISTVSISIADIDKDGRDDIVEFNSGRYMYSYVIFNRGMVNGQPKYERQPFYFHANKASLVGGLIDYDNDGDLDIVFVEMVMARCNVRGADNICTEYGISANGSSGSPVTLKLHVVKNQGAFSATSPRVSFDLPNTYKFNQDPNLYYKTLDVKTYQKTSATKNSLLFINDRFEDHYILTFNNSRPAIKKVPKSEYLGNFWTGFVADLDQDGIDDFVNLCSYGTDSGIYYGNGANTFEVALLEDSCNLAGANAVDLNMDGYMDIVAGTYRSNGTGGSIYELVAYFGGPNREFSAKEVIQTNMPKLYELGAPIEFINIDGNRWMDFAVGTYQAADMLILTNMQ